MNLVAHSWMKDAGQASQDQEKLDARDCRRVEAGISSLPAPFITRNQDFSFSDGNAVICEDQMGQSPVFTCKSSFSSYLLDNGGTPSPVPGGFSFSSCVELDSATEFSSPIPKLPSFTFFSPCSTVDEGNSSMRFRANLSLSDVLQEGVFFLLLGPFILLIHYRFRLMVGYRKLKKDIGYKNSEQDKKREPFPHALKASNS